MCIFGRIQKCTKKIAAVKKMPDVYSGLAEILQTQSWQSEIALLPQAMKNFGTLMGI